MTRLVLAAILSAAVCCSCASRSNPAAERVVRSWSAALNTGDNDSAANLFAKDARIVQGGLVLTLRTHADAVAWNASLPCSGRIVALSRSGNDVTATFVLHDRATSPCDGPGERARALFRVENGKIVLWHQLPSGGSLLPEV